jgi:hypothetical protein
LNHVPLEALLVDGQPLGVLTAVARIPVPGGRNQQPQAEQVVAYLDPNFAWKPEEAVLDTWTHDEHVRVGTRCVGKNSRVKVRLLHGGPGIADEYFGAVRQPAAAKPSGITTATSSALTTATSPTIWACG